MAAGGVSTPEYTVLGIVSQDGPCTTYQVMLRMASSPSSFYRKRASSTYAVVEKLTRLGLVEAVGEAGTRGERHIVLTEAGAERLRTWLRQVPEVEVAHSNDLVRLRANFMDVLGSTEQLEFVETSLATLKKLRDEQENPVPNRTAISTIAQRGLLYETKARILWLEEVRAELVEGSFEVASQPGSKTD